MQRDPTHSFVTWFIYNLLLSTTNKLKHKYLWEHHPQEYINWQVDELQLILNVRNLSGNYSSASFERRAPPTQCSPISTHACVLSDFTLHAYTVWILSYLIREIVLTIYSFK